MVPEREREAEAAPAGPAVAPAAAPAAPVVRRVLEMQASAGNRMTTAALARNPKPAGKPLVISAGTFEDAASQFSALISAEQRELPTSIIVANGSRARVFDGAGAARADGDFRFKRPVTLPAGVFMTGADRKLRVVVELPAGGFDLSGAGKGDVDFLEDIDDYDRWRRVTGDTRHYYVFATAKESAEAPATPPPEQLPEFMQFEAKNKANLPPWPAVVSPLTPQIATVGSIGGYRCDVDKNIGVNTLDRVTNLMEPTDFRWEVLKLDGALKVQGKASATKVKGVKGKFDQRLKHVEEDRQTLLGDKPEQQSILEKAARRIAADQITDARAALAVTGEVAMTFVNAIAGDTKTPNVKDYIDVPWQEPGDYFVRCLATPRYGPDAKYRRATSVAGLMVSVFDPVELAGAGVKSAEEERDEAETGLEAVEADLAKLDDPQLTAGMSDVELAMRRKLGELLLAHRKRLVAAAGDTQATKESELTYVEEQIAYLKDSEARKDPKLRKRVDAALKDLEKRRDGLNTTLKGATDRFGSDMTPKGMMSAALVNADTGERTDLTFAVAERIYVAAGKTEIEIADVTGAKGRKFSGTGDGIEAAGRAGAWDAALRDLRRNLGRGRGWLAYRAPKAYADLRPDVPNPMQLQMAALDQVHEMVDDAANAATLAALVAAPFTGGASLGALAVLGPIQAGSSLYRVVDRALYSDLQLDEAAVLDLVNIASLGLGKLSTLKSGARGLQIVATGSNVAVRVLDRGQLLWMTYKTFQELTKPVEGEDERQGRRRRLLKLLEWAQAAAIPVADSLWGQAKGTAPMDDPHAKPKPEEKTPKPAPTPAAKKGLTKALPKDLDVPIEIDPKLDAGTVRVEYLKNPKTGELFDVRIVCGEKATAADIRLHVPTARAMLRYTGLSGRVRLLLHEVGRMVGLHGEPPVGSRAWEAKLEVEKLPAIIEDRVTQLADPALKPEQRAELEADLTALEAQFSEHAKVLRSGDTEAGQGWVAAELPKGATEAKKLGYPDAEPNYHWRVRYGQLEYVAGKGQPKRHYNPETKRFEPGEGAKDPKVPFVDGATKAEAYKALGGFDRANTDFGEYTHVLVNELKLATHEEIISLLQEPAGRMPDTVRSNVKKILNQRLADHLRNPARLQETDAFNSVLMVTGDPQRALKAASHAEMVRVTRMLSPEDRGSLAERWYRETHAPDATPQVGLAKKDYPHFGEKRRSIDMMEGGVLRELKNVQHGLNPGDRRQIQDLIALVNAEVPVRGGEPRKVERVEVTFLDPLGVKRNEAFMRETLKANTGLDVRFEIFNSRGETRVVTEKTLALLNEPGLSKWLRLPAKTAK